MLIEGWKVGIREMLLLAARSMVQERSGLLIRALFYELVAK